MQGAKQIRRLELKTGQIHEITSGESVQQGQSSSGGGLAPEISPDGRWLAFARRIPDGTISYKGLKFGPRTALWLRDLETGAERLLMDPIEVDMGEFFGLIGLGVVVYAAATLLIDRSAKQEIAAYLKAAI